MGYDRTQAGTSEDGVALSLAAGTATGTATVTVQAGGTKGIHAKCFVGVRVTAYAGWGGTVTFTPYLASGDTLGGEPTAVAIGDLVASGLNGVKDLPFHGVYKVGVSVAGNNKATEVIASTFGSVEKGAV